MKPYLCAVVLMLVFLFSLASMIIGSIHLLLYVLPTSPPPWFPYIGIVLITTLVTVWLIAGYFELVQWCRSK